MPGDLGRVDHATSGRSRRRADRSGGPPTLADNAQVRVRLSFAAPYSGTLHLYAVDWDSTTRRQNVIVNDGTTTKTIAITTDFSTGAWMHFPVSVGAGGSVLDHRQPRGRRQRRPERRVPRRRRDTAAATAAAAPPVRDGTPGQLGRDVRRRRLRPRRVERVDGRPRGHAPGHDHARAGRAGDLGRVDLATSGRSRRRAGRSGGPRPSPTTLRSGSGSRSPRPTRAPSTCTRSTGTRRPGART